jgi:NagD protein
MLKLERMGVEVEEEHFYTSALATATFIESQAPGSSVYVIGDAGLYNALYDAGLTINDINPDYVVVGETRGYNYESVIRAVRLVNEGSKLIGTNYDMTGPSEEGIIPEQGL